MTTQISNIDQLINFLESSKDAKGDFNIICKWEKLRAFYNQSSLNQGISAKDYQRLVFFLIDHLQKHSAMDHIHKYMSIIDLVNYADSLRPTGLRDKRLDDLLIKFIKDEKQNLTNQLISFDRNVYQKIHQGLSVLKPIDLTNVLENTFFNSKRPLLQYQQKYVGFSDQLMPFDFHLNYHWPSRAEESTQDQQIIKQDSCFVKICESIEDLILSVLHDFASDRFSTFKLAGTSKEMPTSSRDYGIIYYPSIRYWEKDGVFSTVVEMKKHKIYKIGEGKYAFYVEESTREEIDGYSEPSIEEYQACFLRLDQNWISYQNL